MSANRAVTFLRSPSARGEAVCSAEIATSDAFEEGAGAYAVAFRACSAVPQSPQKRLSGGFSAPHLGHRFSSAAPQSPQNFLPSGVSLPHLGQRISSPVGRTIRT